MQIFLLIDRYYEHRIFRIQQFLRQLQPFLHKRQPFTVPVLIGTIDIIVIVFPVTCAGIVWWVYVNAINLLGIEIFQKLKRMVIISFDQCMPKIRIRRIADRINRFQIWINWLTEFRYRDKVNQCQFFHVMILPMFAGCIIPIN